MKRKDLEKLSIDELNDIRLEAGEILAKKRALKSDSVRATAEAIFKKHKDLLCNTSVEMNIKLDFHTSLYLQGKKASINFPYHEVENSPEFKEFADKIDSILSEVDVESYDYVVSALDILIKDYDHEYR